MKKTKNSKLYFVESTLGINIEVTKKEYNRICKSLLISKRDDWAQSTVEYNITDVPPFVVYTLYKLEPNKVRL